MPFWIRHLHRKGPMLVSLPFACHYSSKPVSSFLDNISFSSPTHGKRQRRPPAEVWCRIPADTLSPMLMDREYKRDPTVNYHALQASIKEMTVARLTSILNDRFFLNSECYSRDLNFHYERVMYIRELYERKVIV